MHTNGGLRYEPDQPHGEGGKFAKVVNPRPAHGGPESGHPVKPGQAPSPAPVVPTKAESPGLAAKQQGQPPPAQAQAQEPMLPEGLTPDQEAAVQAWMGPQHEQINAQAVSGNKGPYTDVISGLASAIQDSPALDHDQVVYRGLPPGDPMLRNLKPHQVYSMAGFLSASTVPLPASVYSMEITIPRGTKALQLPGELVVDRGAHIRMDVVPLNGNVKSTMVGTAAPKPSSSPPSPSDRSGPEALLARYRSLYMRASSREERAAIVMAAKKVAR